MEIPERKQDSKEHNKAQLMVIPKENFADCFKKRCDIFFIIII